MFFFGKCTNKDTDLLKSFEPSAECQTPHGPVSTVGGRAIGRPVCQMSQRLIEHLDIIVYPAAFLAPSLLPTADACSPWSHVEPD